MASLPAKFMMPEIERYAGIGCPRIHLRLYSIVMRAHGLDEAQMVMLFPMSLSGAAQRWFASLDERVRALRQKPKELVTSFISRWREKISQIIDRPLEKDQINMIMRSLQPRFAGHLMGFPIRILDLWYRLWKKPLGGQRSRDVGAISSAGMRPPRYYQTVWQASGFYYPPSPHRDLLQHTPDPSSIDHHLCAEAIMSVRLVGQYRLASDSTYTVLIIRTQHDTDHCNALRHAIQDLIDQGLVNLGQPSVTANPLPAHSTHAVPPFSGDIHHIDFIGDDSAPTPFSLIPDEAPFQLTHLAPLIIGWPLALFLDDDLPLRVSDHIRPLYITVGCSGCRVPSVLLDNGSALNVCPLATAIALGFAPSDFGHSIQTVRAYDSTKREVLRILASFNLLLGRPGYIESELSLLPFIRRDFVAMSFDQHSSTVVLDMMRGMTFLPGMGLGRHQQGPSEFIAAIDHDMTFGLGFIPTEVDYRYMARLCKKRVRARLSHTPFDYPIRPYRMSLADYFQRIGDSTPYRGDRASMLSLCFPEEITNDGDDREPDYRIVQLQPASPFDMFGVSTVEVLEGNQVFPVPELLEDDSSLFEGTLAHTSISAPHYSPHIFDIDDEVARPDPDRDSLIMTSIPWMKEFHCYRTVEIVDFGTEDQPRELKIGSPLSTDERDRLIHLLRSYLDVFAWSYEDMPGLDPSIVKEDIKKQLSVGFISVVEYPEWLANVVPVPKKDGKRTWRRQPLLLKWGTYCYKVMPFGLKNAGATYQRTATTLFHDMMHRDIEVYVDDMIVKSQGRAYHLEALERFFERIRKFRLRLNRKKCTFGVTFGKLLGHMITVHQSFHSQIDRHIASYARTSTSSIFSVSDMALGCMLAQIDDLGKERAIYYLSKRMLEYEVKYVMIKRLCLALVWATRRLRHYMTELMKWLVLLTEFDIQYVSQKSIKGNLSGWCMYFDGAANQSGYGIGVIVEYEACILGLETALELDIRQMEVFGDSNLRRPVCDALATLASVDIPIDVVIRPLLIEFGTYPEVATAKDRRALRNLATRFVICGDTLYRRSADGMLLLCLDRASADRVMREVHSGVCGPHMGGHILPGHEFILVAIDYFTKWVEAASYVRLTSARVAKVCIRHHRSSAYRPQTNGAVEAANKNIKRILRKMVETSRDWSKKLPFALWAYRTSFRTLQELHLTLSVWLGFDQLNLLDEKKIESKRSCSGLSEKMARAFRNGLSLDHYKKGI
ncbi:Retrovirus-related Pol polyprotein from transposon 17.6 [Vitis vinifera]|uniref:Retrovirus-related Pol polyprotein from transposon 17.6 n=1 Tax=Vitis vinifera TaxID=29760 RepID=A0A438IDW1_VITVI|nr:Retrovirus-related Pol polyprotein from transposon 17.6 [Vitis vinifera]